MGLLDCANQVGEVVHLVLSDQVGIVGAPVFVVVGKEAWDRVGQDSLDRLDVCAIPPDEVSQEVFD